MKILSTLRKLFFSEPEGKDERLNFFVRCPHCETLYTLYHHVNWASIGDVRCGTCSNTFDTLKNKSTPRGKIQIPDSGPYQPKLSRVASLSLTLTDNVSEDEGKSLYKESDGHKQKKSTWLRKAFSFSLFVTANTLVAVVVWMQKETLIQNPTLNGWLTAACGYMDCTIPAYRDPNKIVVQQHQLTANDANAEHLELHALIQNTSSHAQPLSNLQMKIDDLQSNTVETFVIKPTEMVPTDPKLVLDPGETLHISVKLTQPIPDIFSYDLQFIR